MKEIKLTQGKVALVDDEDFDDLSKSHWFALKMRNTFYAVRNNHTSELKGRPGLMHRLILNAKTGEEVDHRDGDGLNNQKYNLRVCTFSQNRKNRKINKNNTSGFKGVYFNKIRQKWTSRIYSEGKGITLGNFDDLKEAARAYDKAALKYHGEFARLNFPEAI